jgi:tetratricopeptide (TPR) repeat protein
MMAKLIADNTADKTGATEGFLYYLAAYPTGYFVGESWLRLAELEFEHNQDKAIEYYLKYFEKYPRHYRIAELQQRVGLIYLQKKKYDDAIAMFKLAFTNIHDDSAAEKSKISASLYKALNEKEKAQNARSTGVAQSRNGDIPR